MSAGLIYGNASGRLMKIVLDGPPEPHVAPGQSLVIISDADYENLSGLGKLQDFINSVSGRTPGGDRTVEVDRAGNVVALHFIDPGCVQPYLENAYQLHEYAAVGWVVMGNLSLAFPPPLRRKADPIPHGLRGRRRAR